MDKKVIIIGSGPAGLTSAIYTSRAGVSTVVVSGDQPGGQLMGTTEVENFPGFPQGIMGPELMDRIKQQALRFGAKFVDGSVSKVDFGDAVKKIYIGETIYEGDAVIVATGSQPRWLGVAREKELLGRGVSVCATCDGYFFKDKKVAVVGGGDSALEEALFLSSLAAKVYVIHRRNELRACKIMREKTFVNQKIEFVWDSVVSDLMGDMFLEGVKLYNLKTSEISDLEISGLFVAIGSIPVTQIFKEHLALDKKGYILVTECSKTSQKGVFVAGDVADSIYRQAISSAGTGCRAALDALSYMKLS